MPSHESPGQGYEASINGQYGRSDLSTQLLAALQNAGKDVDALTLHDLAPFEEIHLRGRAATRDLAQLAELQPGTELLDVGCGVGGPARTLASEFGCQVTGIDLTENYCLAAEMLTARVGLDERVTFRQGNALQMPFNNASFDAVWMQHVAVNIEEKDRLYTEILRVLRPGGSLLFHEITAGTNSELFFPVPWASEPAISFLVAPEEMRQALAAAGFRERNWVDDTGACIAWFHAQLAARTPGSSPPVGFDLVVPNFPEKGRNVLRNLKDERITVVQAVFDRSG